MTRRKQPEQLEQTDENSVITPTLVDQQREQEINAKGQFAGPEPKQTTNDLTVRQHCIFSNNGFSRGEKRGDNGECPSVQECKLPCQLLMPESPCLALVLSACELQITVAATCRRLNAQDLFDDEKARAPSKKKKNAVTNAVTWKGQITESKTFDAPATVEDVQKWIAMELQVTHEVHNCTLKPENVWVFDSEVNLDEDLAGDLAALALESTAALVADASHLALEVFQKLPFNLCRTVTTPEIQPATPCLPENRGFTKMTPVKAAAMNIQGGECKFPCIEWPGWTDNGQLIARGLSANCEDVIEFCDDKDADFDQMNPFKTVKTKEGSHSIPLETFKKLTER